MLALVSRIRRWWETADPQATPPADYRVTCACGRAVEGTRQKRSQIVVCSGCRRELFILPRSPLPPIPADPQGTALRPTALPGQRTSWRWLVIPAVALAGVAGLILVVLAPWSGPSPSASTAEPGRSAPGPREADRAFETARHFLTRGDFYQALAAARTAQALVDDKPDALQAADRHRLTQFHAEAALLANLCTESLEEVLRHGEGRQDAEWQETFRQRYRGKGLIFDTDVWQLPDGKYRHSYRVLAAGEEASLDLEDLRLLKALPLEQPQRLVFGARLHSAVRGRAGGWVVRFEENSGVLLTEEAAVALCCPALGTDAGKHLLRRQRRWALGGDADAPAQRGK